MMGKRFLFFLLFFLIIPISFGGLYYENISENFITAQQINSTDLSFCNSTDMTSNLAYWGSAGYWNVCRASVHSDWLLNISDEGGQGVQNTRTTWRDGGVTTEELLDNIVFYKAYLGDGFYLPNTTEFAFSGRTESSATPAFDVCWFFINSSGFGNIVSHSGTACGLNTNLFGGTGSVGFDLNDDPYMQSLSFTVFNSTSSPIGTGTPDSMTNRYYEYIGFTIYHRGAGARSFVDQVNLSAVDLGYGTNEMPECNISVDSYNKCLGSLGETEFEVTADCYDADNDQLRYSQESIQNEEYQEYYLQDFDDYSVFGTTYFNTNDTKVWDNKLDAGLCNLGFGYYTPCITKLEFDDDGVLYVQKGVDDFYFEIPRLITNSTTISYMLGLVSPVSLNIEYHSTAEEELDLEIEATTGGNLTITAEGTLLYNDAHINTTKENVNEIGVAVGENGIYYELMIYRDSTLIYGTNVTADSDFKYLLFKDLNSYGGLKADYWTLDELTINGWHYSDDLTFVSTISNYTQEQGTYKHLFHYTDDFHQLTEWETEEIWLSVHICDDYYEAQNQTGSIIGVTKTHLGDNIINFLKVNNAYENGKTSMWFIFLFMIIFGCIANYTMFQRMMLIEVVLGSSFTLGLISILLAYVINAVSFLALGSIMLAILIGREQTI